MKLSVVAALLLFASTSAFAGVSSVEKGDFVEFRLVTSEGAVCTLKTTVVSKDEASDRLVLRTKATGYCADLSEKSEIKLSTFVKNYGFDSKNCAAMGGVIQNMATDFGWMDACHVRKNNDGDEIVGIFSDQIPLTGLIRQSTMETYSGKVASTTLIDFSGRKPQ